MVMGKIEGMKLHRKQRLMWLQNIKEWTGMTLEMMINKIRNWEEWRRIVCQLQIAYATQMDGWISVSQNVHEQKQFILCILKKL